MPKTTSPPTLPYPVPRAHRLALGRHRFAILFVFLLASLLVYPYAESNRFGFYAFRTLGSAVTLLTVYAVTFRRNLIILVLFLAVPALLQRMLVSPADFGGIVLFNRALSLAFDIIIIGIIYRHVYSELEPSSETIFGALSVYLLLGYTFASVYALISSLQPAAFFLNPLSNTHQVPDRFDFIYFSFGTMTELGTPGIIAISREVRSISLLQAVLGIFYLAVLISRLMGAYQAHSSQIATRSLDNET